VLAKEPGSEGSSGCHFNGFALVSVQTLMSESTFWSLAWKWEHLYSPEES